MVDNKLLPVAEFFLNPVASYLNEKKISANVITIIGFVIGILAVPFIISSFFKIAIILICLSFISNYGNRVTRSKLLNVLTIFSISFSETNGP